MEDKFKQIRESQDKMIELTKELKNITDVSFPTMIEGVMDHLKPEEKALFQEFAKESGKILNNASIMDASAITDEIEKLRAKYEQRTNNTPGV